MQFDPKAHVTLSTSVRHGVVANGSKIVNFNIPHTKMKPEGDTINVSDSTCECSAIDTLEHHLTSNTDIPSDALLFAFETADNSWSPMKCTRFIDRYNEIWHEEGMPSVKGHGFHIGGTTHLLLLGVDPWIIMVQGHWSSPSFLCCWWKCEEILSLFIGFLFQSHESIVSTMSTFKNCFLSK